MKKGQQKQRKFLFYMGHPAHFHLFKETIKALQYQGVDCLVLIKSKDVLVDLLEGSGMPYINVFKEERKDGIIPLFTSFAAKLWKLGKLVKSHKPELLIASGAEFAILGKLFRIPSIILFEDDFEAIPQFAKLVGPFATHLVCPESCSAGKWEHKAIKYQGYHELAYLSPKYFRPAAKTFEQLDRGRKNYLLRFSKLKAYHDTGINGIQDQLANQLVDMLEENGKVFITSERQLPPKLEQHRIQIDASNMHDFMEHIDLLVCDSQTMTAEAAVLGIPSVRFNGFVGRLGYLEELEHRYRLTYGIKSRYPEKLLEKVRVLMNQDDLKKIIKERRQKMLNESIDVTHFLTDFLFNYPDSVKTKN